MDETSFMESSLVIWASTFEGEVTLNNFVSGCYLNDIYYAIDTENVKDTSKNDYLHNWINLVNNIYYYYHEILGHHIVLKPPDIRVICLPPISDCSLDEIKRALLLLLGCAVQGRQKEKFVRAIRNLDEGVQIEIMKHIQQVTDNSIPKSHVHDHLQELLKQRDEYVMENMRLLSVPHPLNTSPHDVLRTPTSVLVVQAEDKAVVRSLKQQLMNKGDLLLELEDEVQMLLSQVNSLKTHNMEITQQLKQALECRDEVDEYKEKLKEMGEKEEELRIMRKKMKKFEELQNQIVQLDTEKRILQEHKCTLESQLEEHRKELCLQRDLSIDLIRCKHKLQSVLKEQEEDQEKIRSFVLKVENLQKQVQFHKESSSSQQLPSLTDSTNSDQEHGNSLAEQLLQASKLRMLHLESKVERLQGELDRKSIFSHKFMTFFDLENSLGVESKMKEDEKVDDNGEDLKDEEKKEEEDDEVEGTKRKEKIEEKVIDFVSKLRDDNIELLQKVNFCERKMRQMETSSSLMSEEKNKMAFVKVQLELKINSLEKEKEMIEKNLVEVKEDGVKMAEDIKKLKVGIREKNRELSEVEEEKEGAEEEIKQMRDMLREKNLKIEELKSQIQEANNSLSDWSLRELQTHELQERLYQLEVQLETCSKESLLDKKTIASLREDLLKEVAFGTRLPHKPFEEAPIRNTKVDGEIKEDKISNGFEEKSEEEENKDQNKTLIVTQRYSNSPSATQQIIALKQQISQLLSNKEEQEEEMKMLRGKMEEVEERCRKELCHVSTLETQAAQMRMVVAEKERKVEEFKEEKFCLENNCRSLQKLHDKLGVENEVVTGELSNVKIQLRNNKIQLKNALQQISSLEAQLHNNNNDGELKQQIASLHKETTQLQHENNTLNANVRKSKSELNRCKSELLKVKEETSNVTQQEINHLKVELSRLKRIEQLCGRLEEENQMLKDQLNRTGNNIQQHNTQHNNTTKHQANNIQNNTPNKQHHNAQHNESFSSFIIGRADNSFKSGDHSFNSLVTYMKENPILMKQESSTPVLARNNGRSNKVTSKASQVDAVDNEAITLNQFLFECDRSPKERRRFLVKKGIELDVEEGVNNKQTFPRPKSPVFLEGYGKKGYIRSKSAINHKEFEEKKTFTEKLLNLQKSKKTYKNKIDLNQVKSKIMNNEVKQKKDPLDHVVGGTKKKETDKNKISNKSDETSCSQESSESSFKILRPFSAGVEKNSPFSDAKLPIFLSEKNNENNQKINNQNVEKNEKTLNGGTKQKHRFGMNSRTRPFPTYGCF